MSEKQAKDFFPDQGKLTGTPYGENSKQFDKDSTRNTRTQAIYRRGIADGVPKKEMQSYMKQKQKEADEADKADLDFF